MLKLTKIRQHFKHRALSDIKGTLLKELEAIKGEIAPGANIAIAAGSRGIVNLAEIVKTTVEFVKKQGGVPFIVPAMGSHGGATAAGQAEVLAGYGITEDYVQAPVKSSMEVVEIASDGPCRVFMDKLAYESDGVILINRIKAHTDYHGTYESGLVKMAVIGLGKHDQALEIHKFGVHGLKKMIPIAAKKILASGKIIAGVGLVEDAYHATMAVKVMKADRIMKEEPKLLELSKKNMPRLPVDKIDVLIVDRLGKDISGVGMDPNIIGRMYILGEPEPKKPVIKYIVVCDVTEASHGNTLGMGLANVTTKKLFNKINYEITYENVYTSTFLERAKIPVVANTDAEAFSYVMRSSGPIPQNQQRIVRIYDTLALDEVYVSQAILKEISHKNSIEVLGDAVEMFDEKGGLKPF